MCEVTARACAVSNPKAVRAVKPLIIPRCPPWVRGYPKSPVVVPRCGALVRAAHRARAPLYHHQRMNLRQDQDYGLGAQLRSALTQASQIKRWSALDKYAVFDGVGCVFTLNAIECEACPLRDFRTPDQRAGNATVLVRFGDLRIPSRAASYRHARIDVRIDVRPTIISDANDLNRFAACVDVF